MTEEKFVTCIVCPKGCRIKVILDEGDILDILNYGCKRGVEYAREEVMAPKRILTTTVAVQGQNIQMLPVKTEDAIPKELLKVAMHETKDLCVEPPIKIGDVIWPNIAGTGVNIIATRTLDANV